MTNQTEQTPKKTTPFSRKLVFGASILVLGGVAIHKINPNFWPAVWDNLNTPTQNEPQIQTQVGKGEPLPPPVLKDNEIPLQTEDMTEDVGEVLPTTIIQQPGEDTVSITLISPTEKLENQAKTAIVDVTETVQKTQQPPISQPVPQAISQPAPQQLNPQANIPNILIPAALLTLQASLEAHGKLELQDVINTLPGETYEVIEFPEWLGWVLDRFIKLEQRQGGSHGPLPKLLENKQLQQAKLILAEPPYSTNPNYNAIRKTLKAYLNQQQALQAFQEGTQ